jgi:hypothetical protein
MSTHIIHRVESDLGPPVNVELVGTDITGWTIQLQGTYRDTFKPLDIAHVEDVAAEGKFHFDWGATDLVRGVADWEIFFTPIGGQVFTIPAANSLLLKVRGKKEPGPGVLSGGGEQITISQDGRTIKIFGGGGGGSGTVNGSIPLGVPTDGDYLGGAFPFTPTTQVNDAIDDLNELAGVPVDGSILLGTPTDGSYLDGAIPLTATDKINDAIDALNEFVGNIAAKAGDLVGQALAIDISVFTGKLPSGLSGAWGSYTPGDTITTLVTAGTYVLTSPDTATRFRAGVASDPATAGVLTHVLDSVDADARDIGAQGVGTTGVLEVFALDVFNGIWLKANARINFTQGEGLKTHELRHTEAGLTALFAVYHDDVNTAPTFFAGPTHGLNTELTRFLSGIQYYREGTIFDVNYTAASGIFTKAYHPTAVSSVDVPSATTVTENPPTPPAVADTFVVATTITLASSNVAQGNNSSPPDIDVTLRKPDGSNLVGSSALARGINTYASGGSTPTKDIFVDELFRLQLGTATPFVSTAALVDGNAQVRNGDLVHGADGDYGAHVANAEYERLITPGVQSGGTVRLAGLTAATIAQFATGQLNILLLLETDAIWFDLGLAVGLNNGTGSGSSPANSKGAKISASGGDLVFSLGTFSTGNNSNQYRIQIRYLGANGLVINSVEGL